MSELTDYFKLLANKIRGLTRKTATMTLDQMVNELDVVYDTGVSENTKTLNGRVNCKPFISYEWTAKTWNITNLLRGQHIWTDGEHIYFSYQTNQYVLDPVSGTWTAKTWTGLTNFNGQYIWKNGSNIYYSYNANQYVLDKSTSTWTAKTWNGLTSFTGQYIWTDGSNTYYSYNAATQYVLNKSTSTWVAKTWSGTLIPLSGADVWTDGVNMYYCGGDQDSQYVLTTTKIGCTI